MAEELVGKAQLNGLLIHVTSEDANFDVDIPTHKVEKGIDLSDHVERKPEVVKLSGLLIRPTNERVESLISKLKNIEIKGQLVTYEGRRIYKNMLMSGLSIKASSKVMNGYNFSCTLTEVRIAQSSYVAPEIKAVTAPVAEAGRKQTENKKGKEVYHVIKKGDTFSSLGQKYGTKWQDIQKWSGYDPQKLPVGVKIRVV
ncbi:LysM peptidoglycan-binding domain-containing protein [Lysinibacillus sp. NPDC097162]|uniref:LysM peptidoglycan-binding domain-containing protein n=1 Tax=Lysinibacillus sp. NPDC097162 TaxID=3364140 RepID=UPI0037FEBD27